MAVEVPGPRSSDFIVNIPTQFNRETVAQLIGPYTVPELLPPLEPDTFQDQLVLVTGSTRGIGEATARRFATLGATVIVNSRPTSEERGLEIVDSIREQGGKAFYMPADITDGSQVRRLFKGIDRNYGLPDIVINNAGIIRDKALPGMSETDWDEVIRTNLKGPFLVTKEAIRLNLRNGGKIIYNSSVAAIGTPGQGNYSAAKAAMEILGHVAARESNIAGLPFDFGVFRIALVDTELTSDIPPEDRQKLIDITPSQRVFTADEAAVGITYLASLPGDQNVHQLTFA